MSGRGLPSIPACLTHHLTPRHHSASCTGRCGWEEGGGERRRGGGERREEEGRGGRRREKEGRRREEEEERGGGGEGKREKEGGGRGAEYTICRARNAVSMCATSMKVMGEECRFSSVSSSLSSPLPS